MAKQKPFVTEAQWIRLEPFGQNLSLQPKVDENPEATGKCLAALSGCCGVEWGQMAGLADRCPSASTC